MLKKTSALFLILALIISCCFTGLTASAAETVVDSVLTQSDSTSVPEFANPITATVTVLKLNSDVTPWTTNLSALQDGVTDKDCYINSGTGYSQDTNGDGTVDALKPEGEYYVDLIYDLGAIYDIKNIVANNHPYEAKSRVNVMQIYVSNSRDNLISDENMVYRFENAAQAVQQLFTFSGDKAQSGRYVGFRVLDPMCDTTTLSRDVRFRELRVYGTPVSDAWIHEGPFAAMPEEVPVASIGSMGSGTISYDEEYTNLLAGKKIEVFANFASGDRIQNAYGWDSFSWIANNKHDSVDVSYDKSAIGQIIFHLENTVTPEYFVWIGRDNLAHNTTGFEIYGANSYADIRNNATRLASYHRSDNTADNKIIAYKFGSDAPTFKYFKVVLLPNSANPVPDASWRFCEIMLLGDEAEDGATPNPFSYDSYYKSGNLVLPTIENPITAPTVEATVNNAIAKNINNPSYLQDGLANYNNESGIANTTFGYKDGDGKAVWQTNGEKTGEIIYDLGSLYDVDNILVVHHNYIANWRTRHYKIYAGTSRDDLFEDKNMIFDYINDEDAQIQKFSLEDNSYQFVGLRIYDPCQTKKDSDVTNSGIRLYEFRVYGTKAHTCVFDQEKAEASYLKTEATCQAAAIYYKSCECGIASKDETFSEGIKNPENHIGEIVASNDNKPATSATPGLEGKTVYSVCGHIANAGTVLPALGYEVIFADYNGAEVYSVNIQAGESASEAAIIAEAKLARYGYTFVGWNEEVSVINSDVTFIATYKRDTVAKYGFTVNGESYDNVAFDAKITVNAGKEALWKVNGQKYHIGASVTMYAFGDMVVEAVELDESIDKTKAFVSLLGTVSENGKFVAFIHVYSGDEEVEEYGAYYWNLDNIESFKTVGHKEGADLMTTLYGITSGKKRGVKAYAIVGGNMIYSEVSKDAIF